MPPAYRVRVHKCASFLDKCVNLQHFVTERCILISVFWVWYFHSGMVCGYFLLCYFSSTSCVELYYAKEQKNIFKEFLGFYLMHH